MAKKTPPITARANFDLPADEYNTMRAAASLDGESFAVWARKVLMAAAKERVWSFAKKPLPALGGGEK